MHLQLKYKKYFISKKVKIVWKYIEKDKKNSKDEKAPNKKKNFSVCLR